VPFWAAVTAIPGASSGRSARKSAEGLGTSTSPPAFISKTPISLAEPNRSCAPGARGRGGRCAFEIEDRVDHVLEHARPGNRAVFGYVSHEKGGRFRGLGISHEARGHLADLRDGSRRGLKLGKILRLYRIDGKDRWPQLFRGMEHLDRVGLRKEVKVLGSHAEPVGAQLHLSCRFLARHVEYRSVWSILGQLVERCESRVLLRFLDLHPRSTSAPGTTPRPKRGRALQCRS